MPALLTKMSRGPKASAVLATAARSSSAEPLSALRDSALSPADSISRTSSRAFSGELKYVKATDAPSAASRRTMPAPMPLEPPVTRATLPLNDFACICHQTPLSHLLCPFWIILSRMAVQPDGKSSRIEFRKRFRCKPLGNFFGRERTSQTTRLARPHRHEVGCPLCL